MGPEETLSHRRERELTEACQALGVARNEFLGYRDSGMQGEPTNDDPSSFWRAPVDEAAKRLAELLVAEQADVLTAYDENGVYGHPDHVQVHRVGLRAAQLAGTPRVFMATINRDHIKGLTERAEEFGIADMREMRERRDEIESMGVEATRITTAVDVSAHLEAKRRAMAAHASQISEASFFLAMPPEAFAAVWGTEWYIRLGAPAQSELEGSLVG